MRKAFESLSWYTLTFRQRKKALEIMAGIQFKRRIMTKWIVALNRVQEVKERIWTEDGVLKTKENSLDSEPIREEVFSSVIVKAEKENNEKSDKRSKSFSRSKSSLVSFAPDKNINHMSSKS